MGQPGGQWMLEVSSGPAPGAEALKKVVRVPAPVALGESTDDSERNEEARSTTRIGFARLVIQQSVPRG
jgi:hypothetical protein